MDRLEFSRHLPLLLNHGSFSHHSTALVFLFVSVWLPRALSLPAILRSVCFFSSEKIEAHWHDVLNALKLLSPAVIPARSCCSGSCLPRPHYFAGVCKRGHEDLDHRLAVGCGERLFFAVLASHADDAVQGAAGSLP